MGLRNHRLFVLLALSVAAALLPIQSTAAATVTPVTSGLDSPRGIAFFDGKLVVGEAGHGGSACFSPPGAPPGFQICVGGSGQISKVNSNGTHTPFVTGLFSFAAGPEALGVSGLSASDERLLVQIGTTSREVPPGLNSPLVQQAGELISVHPDGTWKPIANVGNFNFDYTTHFTVPTPGVYSPGTQEHDANPYGVLATDDGAYVVDAGSNTLDRVGEEGKIKILIYDGWRDLNANNFPSDSVPTCVVKTADGFLIGELSGRVLKVHGANFTVINKALFTHITGCISDHHGNVYFVNMFGGGIPFTDPSFFVGNVVQYNIATGATTKLADLPLPNMDTIGPDGNLYVTTGAICPAVAPAGGPCKGMTGGVVKITLPHNGEGDD